MWSRARTTWCRCSIARGGCSTTSASRAPDSAISGCPLDFFIDHNDRVFVVDSYNHRVQIFQYYGLKQAKGGVQ